MKALSLCLAATLLFSSQVCKASPDRAPPFPVQEGWNCEPLLSSKPEASQQEGAEKLQDSLQVRWSIDSSKKSISLEAVAHASDAQYVAFGVSGADSVARMVGSDAAVAYLSPDGGHVVRDFFITGRKLCKAGVGVCPDDAPGLDGELGEDQFSNVSASRYGQLVRYAWTRPLAPSDPRDLPILPAGNTSIVWSIGPVSDVEPEAAPSDGDVALSYHGNQTLPYGARFYIEFGRKATATDCKGMFDESQAPRQVDDPPPPWASRPVLPLKSSVDIWAYLGPSGGALGMEQVSGKPSAGLIWYVGQSKDEVIPGATLGVVRGETYNFRVAGGKDRLLYITSSPDGGNGVFDDDEAKEIVYAGPSTKGERCALSVIANETGEVAGTYPEFAKALKNPCGSIKKAEAESMAWTVEAETPDLVYYQSRDWAHMGWRIRVFDTIIENTAENLAMDNFNDPKLEAEGTKGEELETESEVAGGSGDEDLPIECSVMFLKDILSFQSCQKNIADGSIEAYWSVDLEEGTITTLFSGEFDDSGWVAWGWTSSPDMVPGSAAVAFTDGSIVDHILTSKYPGGAITGEGQGFLKPGEIEVQRSGSGEQVRVLGLYTRTLDADLEYAIWSLGAPGDSKSTLTKHTSRGAISVDLSKEGYRK